MDSIVKSGLTRSIREETRTRAVVAERLARAGWTAVNETDWQSPEGEGPHSWPVALLVADLPRIKHETPQPPPPAPPSERRWRKWQRVTPERLAELTRLLEVERLTQSAAAARLGISRQSVENLWKRVRQERQARLEGSAK